MNHSGHMVNVTQYRLKITTQSLYKGLPGPNASGVAAAFSLGIVGAIAGGMIDTMSSPHMAFGFNFAS